MGLVVAFAALGTLIAAAHSAALAWDVRLYVRPGTTRAALLVHALRSIGIALAFVAVAVAAPRGLVPALAGFAVVQLAVLAAAHRGASPKGKTT
jgi:hypothetical protein